MLRLLVSILALTIVMVAPAFGEVVFFQPPPHLMKDGYLSNVYHRNGVDGNNLAVGGWGDEYWSLLKFDLAGLPRNATAVYIDLFNNDAGNSSTPVDMNIWLITSPWNEPPTADTVFQGYNLGNIPAPSDNAWYSLRIDYQYNSWKNQGIQNEGFLLRPVANDNRANIFTSSDVPFTERQWRPILEVYYTPTVAVPNFKSPMPGGQSWLLSTEIGGTDCEDYYYNPKYYPLVTHTGENFFALDFVPTAESTGYDGEVPVFAAAGGAIIYSGWNPNKACNGYHVIIDHDYDGSVATGYQTYYLHLRSQPNLGATVLQGQQIGIVGNTGSDKGCGSWGEHLHFQVKYKGQGSPAVDELSFVKVDGRQLRGYLTDCNSNHRRNRFYPSTNTSQ